MGLVLGLTLLIETYGHPSLGNSDDKLHWDHSVSIRALDEYSEETPSPLPLVSKSPSGIPDPDPSAEPSTSEEPTVEPSPSEEPTSVETVSSEPYMSSESVSPTPAQNSYCPAVNTCEEAFTRCKFGFDGYSTSLPTFFWGTMPFRPFTPRIISKELGGPKLGRVDAAGESCVIQRGANRASRISHFQPDGLAKAFSRSFFTVVEYDYPHSASGIGRKKFKSNQAEFLDGLCVIIPLTAYQFLDESYYNEPYYQAVAVHNNPAYFGGDCVAFYLANK
uniref:Uncharacterized protein n=1 Tax=Compsopogon caeruleus TaxID=31354 RepID=A0A7S1T961_9RHOD